jgi:hypothetical protein
MRRLSDVTVWFKWYHTIVSLIGTSLLFSAMVMYVLYELIEVPFGQRLQTLIPLAGLALLFAYSCVFTKRRLEAVDEVLDAGDALLIRNGRQEERIALSEIMKVRYWGFNPPLIILTLRRPSIFGTRVIFYPPMPESWSVSLGPHKKVPIIVKDLRARISGRALP